MKGFPWVNKGIIIIIIIIIIMLLTHTGVYLDTGTTEQLWDGGGGTISDSILGGGTKHFFVLILYNFFKKY